MSKNYLGLNVEGLETVVKELNNYLSNLNLLYVKLHNLHWNIEGNAFFQLHSVFEGYYDGVAEDLDSVAERILTLGFRPAASSKDYVKLGSIEELESRAFSSKEAVDIIEKDFYSMLDHSRIILALAEDAKDQGTIDLMAGFISKYEKTLWMIKAYKA